mmetsp:Transcript_19407/g.62298  ORF Transcript_19407/g.62298 Transcript_19407/m.62298 type:complete len:236 (-) Transcript_19407:3546-4253(-)
MRATTVTFGRSARSTGRRANRSVRSSAGRSSRTSTSRRNKPRPGRPRPGTSRRPRRPRATPPSARPRRRSRRTPPRRTLGPRHAPGASRRRRGRPVVPTSPASPTVLSSSSWRFSPPTSPWPSPSPSRFSWDSALAAMRPSPGGFGPHLGLPRFAPFGRANSGASSTSSTRDATSRRSRRRTRRSLRCPTSGSSGSRRCSATRATNPIPSPTTTSPSARYDSAMRPSTTSTSRSA